jgi:hypothetical protein
MIAIHSDDLASAVEQIQLPADYTINKLTKGQRYLCKTMNTKFPFLPVHGKEEYRLFAKLVLLVSDISRLERYYTNILLSTLFMSLEIPWGFHTRAVLRSLARPRSHKKVSVQGF